MISNTARILRTPAQMFFGDRTEPVQDIVVPEIAPEEETVEEGPSWKDDYLDEMEQYSIQERHQTIIPSLEKNMRDCVEKVETFSREMREIFDRSDDVFRPYDERSRTDAHWDLRMRLISQQLRLLREYDQKIALTRASVVYGYPAGTRYEDVITGLVPGIEQLPVAPPTGASALVVDNDSMV